MWEGYTGKFERARRNRAVGKSGRWYSSSQRDIETFKNKVINSTKCNVKDNYVRPKGMSIGFGKIADNGVLC